MAKYIVTFMGEIVQTVTQQAVVDNASSKEEAVNKILEAINPSIKDTVQVISCDEISDEEIEGLLASGEFSELEKSVIEERILN